jgi:hypothetical protein
MVMIYNELQQKNTAIRQQVEEGLRKLKMGGIPWSPKLQVFRNEIELWRMIVRRRKGIKVSTSRIRRFIKKTGLVLAFTYDLDSSQEQVKLAYKAYKLAKKDASMWREDHLESLAKAKADLGTESHSNRETTTSSQECQTYERKIEPGTGHSSFLHQRRWPADCL